MINTHFPAQTLSTYGFVIAVLWLIAPFVHSKSSLNGVAIYNSFGKELFICGLFLSEKSSNAKEILVSNNDKMVQLRVIAEEGIHPRRHRTMWSERIAVNTSPNELAGIANELEVFEKMINHELVKNDILSISRVGSSTFVVLNGIELGRLDGTRFFDYFLRVFIGPVPLSSGLRESLLQATDIDENLTDRFVQTRPNDLRIQEVKSKIESGSIKAEKIKLAVPKTATKITKPVQKPRVIKKKKTNNIQKVSKSKSPIKKSPPKKPVEKPVVTKADIRAEEEYISKVKKRIDEFLAYPPSVKSKFIERTLIVKVKINAKGDIESINALGKSKADAFFKQSVESINAAAPFSALPGHLKQSGLTIPLRVAFKVHRIQRVYDAFILD